jgi:hypothetical protein
VPYVRISAMVASVVPRLKIGCEDNLMRPNRTALGIDEKFYRSSLHNEITYARD